MARSVVAVLAGVVVGGLTIFVVESLGHLMYPLPENMDWSDKTAVAELLRNAPPGALVMVLIAWALGAAHGAGLGAYLAPRQRWLHGVIVAGVLLLFAIVQLATIPHPLWFAVWTMVVFPVSTVIGILLSTQPLPGAREGFIVKEPPDYSADGPQKFGRR